MKSLKTENGEWEYICNTCFKYKEECKCRDKEHSYLGIDSHIIKRIQILHSKGYQTVGCCEGHVREYETDKGNIYTELSPTYISFDIHSLEDIKRELVKHKEFSQEIKIIPFPRMESERYQLVIDSYKKRGGSFDFFVQKRNERIKNLENLFSLFESRVVTEPIIKTYY